MEEDERTKEWSRERNPRGEQLLLGFGTGRERFKRSGAGAGRLAERLIH